MELTCLSINVKHLSECTIKSSLLFNFLVNNVKNENRFAIPTWLFHEFQKSTELSDINSLLSLYWCIEST